MANAYGRSGTLVAATAVATTIRTGAYGVWVVNRTAATEIWVRLDGQAATVAGNDCFLVLGARNFPVPDGDTVSVSIISSGTPQYSIEGAVPVVVAATD